MFASAKAFRRIAVMIALCLGVQCSMILALFSWILSVSERAGSSTHRALGVGSSYALWVEAQREGGHLWWRRWSPQREVSAGFVMLDDGDMLDDSVDQPEDVAGEVRSWSEGRFTWRGVEYAVSWAGADESRRVRDEVFQLGEPHG